jgi:hypothetical protein
MNLNEFRAKVSGLLEKGYCVTWIDACGDDEPLLQALESKHSPEEFVEQFARKYDLTPYGPIHLRLNTAK